VDLSPGTPEAVGEGHLREHPKQACPPRCQYGNRCCPSFDMLGMSEWRGAQAGAATVSITWQARTFLDQKWSANSGS
jgi:hypothetical protein